MAHKGKVKNIRAGVLHETEEERNPGVVILTFEELALQHEQQNSEFGVAKTLERVVANVFVA